MTSSRRAFLRFLTAALMALVAPIAVLAHPGKHVHPHGVARRHRRRVRRRARWRRIRGRRVLIVPVGVKAGSELLVDESVLVVTEVREKTVVVEHADGHSETIDVHKEDDEFNSEELEGSELESDDE